LSTKKNVTKNVISNFRNSSLKAKCQFQLESCDCTSIKPLSLGSCGCLIT